MFSKRIVFIAFLILALAACNTGAATDASPATPGVNDNGLTAEPAATENAVASADPTAACPQATADTQAYVSQENGFCFLAPATMRSSEGDPISSPDTAAFFGPAANPNIPQPTGAMISVSIMAPSEGLDSAAYAKKWLDTNYPITDGLDLKMADATMGGLPVAVVSNIPGEAHRQIAFVVANGFRYTITASPQPGDFPEIDDEVNAAWKTITESIVFFPPSVTPTVVSPARACPKPVADTALHIDNQIGICFLVPASFSKMPDYTSGFQGAAVLGDIDGRPLHAELTLIDGGVDVDQTPRQLFEPRLNDKTHPNIDLAGAQDTTLSGFPAIVWTEGDPLTSRQAIIVANGHQYYIVNQPYNDPDYRGGEADVELVWQTVTSSLAFFTPFR